MTFSRSTRFRSILGALVALACAAPVAAQENVPAKVLFSRPTTPADMASRAIGSYAKGCLAGAQALPVDGPGWQVMRLSRNRMWGHPDMIAYLERLARDVPAQGWRGLLVGDISQPRGGPAMSGHVSHQMGLDVDIWLQPMPDHTLSNREREDIGANSVTRNRNLELDRNVWSSAHGRFIRQAASYPNVARIFVSPAIKRELCQTAGSDRDWLRVIRPWYGHNDHIHVRLTCPPGQTGCENQSPSPPGDGCGADLDYWFTDAPYRPADPSKPPPPPLTLAGLPRACTDVLTAGMDAGQAAAVVSAVPLPRPRPN